MVKKTNVPRNQTADNGFAIAFLGPDGSGKSTIIQKLLAKNLPFSRYDYFHLKPLFKAEGSKHVVQDNPHGQKPYGHLKSFLKLLFFVVQYNFGWVYNILRLKSQSSLIIFDRYYDDLLVDSRRYRYGGAMSTAKFIRHFIPKPRFYFILTTDADVIYSRKKEVPLNELKRQIVQYRNLADGKRYINIEVNRPPDEIASEIGRIIRNSING
ncbi:hypothetical protein FEE95_01895 [Maribacter algarum]|uniref:Thymidylate kinase n=1 Tax=Maribacter algarum (ex Zhang et al. 2020) TaxID=2578118 RepID=A0A5S3PTC5_9FLAO|nr:hypothetical protein [Maribacter algarum]TMM58203.1 hypothetical protein FEE95_01895 [Maribacter algarum]